MVVEPAKKTATYEDLLAVPENMIGELLSGEIHAQPRPGPKHLVASSVLGGTLTANYDRNSTSGPGGWWIIDEPECHLSSDVLVPDIAGWRIATMLQLPDTAWFDIRPDWICEILSPSSVQNDRVLKRDIYAREQVPYYWLVDPVARVLEVFELTDGKWLLMTTVSENQSANLCPFNELMFEVGRIWA